MSCASVQKWWRAGRPKPLPSDVAAHLKSCVDCRAETACLDEEFAWFDEPAPAFDNATKMRAEIIAAQKTKGVARRNYRRPVGYAFAAGLAALLFFVLQPSTPETIVTPLSEDTRFEEVSGGARLKNGLAHFAVELTGDQPNYTVNVGKSRVQVVGTKFTVNAHEDELVGVDVYEGIVLVFHEGQSHKILAGGHFEPQTKVVKELPLSPPVVSPTPKLVPVPQTKTAPTLPDVKDVARSPAPTSPIKPKSSPKPPVDEPDTAIDVEEKEPPKPDLSPERKPAAFTRAWSEIQAKRYDEALSLLDEVDEASLGDLAPTVGYWRVLSLVKLGRLTQARQAGERLQREYPQSGAAQAAAALIEKSSKD